MLDINRKNSPCVFAERIVDYLYGESVGEEKFNFEAHLASCQNCADELAEFKSVRSTVLEWREADFSKLQTPVFEIPYQSQPKPFIAQTETSRSRFRDFWNLLHLNPAWAFGALAVLTACVVVTLFALNLSRNTEVAEKKADNKGVTTSLSPQPEIIYQEKDVAGKVINDKTDETLPERKVEIVAEKISPPVKTISNAKSNTLKSGAAKVSANAPKIHSEDVARSSINTIGENGKTLSYRRSQKPTLVESVEEEDNSIRLSDLFAEIESK